MAAGRSGGSRIARGSRRQVCRALCVFSKPIAFARKRNGHANDQILDVSLSRLRRASVVDRRSLSPDISGFISSTRTIREDSRLVGDVTCTVNGAPCNGASTAGEVGINTNSQSDVGVRGPGVVQRFRADGILFVGTLLGRVDGVTTTTNCMSGIRVNPTSSRITLEANVSVRNGSTQPGLSCGGI